MKQYKIISDIKDVELKLSDGSKIYSELQERINKLSEKGWQVVCIGPEKNILLKRNSLIEFLRAVPIVNVFINLFFPQIIITSISLILQRET